MQRMKEHTPSATLDISIKNICIHYTYELSFYLYLKDVLKLAFLRYVLKLVPKK